MASIVRAVAQWVSFLFEPSPIANCMIYGPTQMGKTRTMYECLRRCMDHRIPVLVSCDNRTDQLDQFLSRFKIDFAHDSDVCLLCANDKKFKSQLRSSLSSDLKVIVFLLNNASQIHALRDDLKAVLVGDTLGDDLDVPRWALVHDEGDVVTKDKNVDVVHKQQAESHQAWIRLVSFLSSRSILKRAFLTATPENVVYKYNVGNVIRLEPQEGYVGYQQIQFFPLHPENDGIRRCLVSEHERLSTGILLYCTDRRIDNGHDELFTAVCEDVDGVVHTYNGKGIVARCVHPRFVEELTLVAKETVSKIKIQPDLVSKHIYRIQGMPICHFYETCRRLGCLKIVTIGMDLMSRGISFVSSSRAKDTLAAVSMIYSPGTTMHAVGMCQAIGRITGMARPDLERRLHAPPAVIENYVAFMKNQERYLERLQTTKSSTKNTMEEMLHRYKLSCSLDRIKLGLAPKYTKTSYKVKIKEHNETAKAKTEAVVATLKAKNEDQKQKIDGVEIARLQEWMRDKTHPVCRIVSYLTTKPRVSVDKIIKETRLKDAEKRVLLLGSSSSIHGAYGKIWILEDNDNFMRLNPAIRLCLGA